MKKILLSAIVLGGLIGAASTSKAGVSFGVSINDGYGYGREYSSPRCEPPVYSQPSYSYGTRSDCAPSYRYGQHEALHEDLHALHHDSHADLNAEHYQLHRDLRHARGRGVSRWELSAEHRQAHRELSAAHRDAHDDLRDEHREGHYDLR